MSSSQISSANETLPGVSVNNRPPNPFDSLPIETTQHIATLVDSDTALCAFQATCRSARAAIDGDNFSLWRRRFVATFESTGWSQRENINYKLAYQHRRRVLKNGAHFREGRGRDERECLDVVRELILNAFSETEKEKQTTHITRAIPAEQSLNIAHLIRFLKSTNLLTTIFAPTATKTSRYNQPLTHRRSDPLLDAIRVLCAPLLLSLDAHLRTGVFGFPDSQAAVYAPASKQAFFGGHCGLDINMEFVLHHINFWRYHMVRTTEQTLYSAFEELTDKERPQWWNSKLQQGERKLGKYWKGSYAYLDHAELETLRGTSDPNAAISSSKNKHDIGPRQFQDIFAGEDAAFSFQDMTLEMLPPEKRMKWPEAFERHLKSLSPPAPTSPGPSVRTRAQKRSGTGGTPEEVADFGPLSFRFDGAGEDSTETFLASGWLNPMPTQQGVPGWRRLTMMKYFDVDNEDNDGSYGGGSGVVNVSVDWDALWAYEGVVLPGGKIVVGRWWSPGSVVGDAGDGEEYSGPFVLWCVDGAEGKEFGGIQAGGEGEDMEHDGQKAE